MVFHSVCLISVTFFDIFFFFNDPATTEIYTLSLHDALPISATSSGRPPRASRRQASVIYRQASTSRSEEHTSELQSLRHLVCRLLLEKKKKKIKEKYTVTETTPRSMTSKSRITPAPSLHIKT